MSTPPIKNRAIQGLVQARVEPTRPAATPNSVQPTAAEFDSILSDRLKLSGHAKTRLESRSIELGQAEWERVMAGVEKAAAKGARESLVLLDDIALVVSVRNRTVITAVEQARLKENVFTNIDSAVIV